MNKLICNFTNRSGYTSVLTVRKTMELQCTGIMAYHVLLAMTMAYIALYLLLDVGFSTLFFVHDYFSEKHFCCLVPVHNLWNMEHGFFQASDTTFLCESETDHTWGRNMRLHLCCMYGVPLLHQSLQLSVRPAAESVRC